MQNLEKQQSIVAELEKKQKEIYPDAKVFYIKENVYGVEFDTGNVGYFINGKGDIIFNTDVGKDNFEDKTMKLAGYKKFKEGKLYNLYKIDKDGNKIGSLIDKHSIEYFEAFNDMSFYNAYLTNAQPQSLRLSKEQFKKLLPLYIESGSFRIKDLKKFLDRKQISETDFKKELPKLIELFKSQVTDVRFEKLKDEVNEKEIEGYIKSGYIDKNFGNTLKSLIRQREEKKNEKETKKQEVHSQTRIEVKDIYSV